MSKKSPLATFSTAFLLAHLAVVCSPANAGESCEEMNKDQLDAYLCNAKVAMDVCILSAGNKGYLGHSREKDICFQVLNTQELKSYDSLSSSNKKLVSRLHSELATMEESLHMVKDQVPATQLHFIQPYEYSIRTKIAELKKK